MDIPKDIEKYLVRDEIVDKQFDLKDLTVFTSIKRLFIEVFILVLNSFSSRLKLAGRVRWKSVK